MRGVEPVAASHKAYLVTRLYIEKQAPAFLPYLNIIDQTI